MAKTLIVRDNQLGFINNNRFDRRTNFSVSILCFVITPPEIVNSLQGFVYQITGSDGQNVECFVDNDNSQTLHLFSKVVRHKYPWILKSRVPDSIWSQFIFEKADAFCRGPFYCKKTIVTCVGRQPNSCVWVFGPDIQINAKGKLIPKEEQKFYWVPNYTPVPDLNRYLVPADIHLPLTLNVLITLLETAKECLSNNFMSCFAAISGSIILFHYQSILEAQDECPLLLCYSHLSGTGKTSTLKVVLSIYGVSEENGNSQRTSPSSLVTQAAMTTLPLGVDDINNKKKMEDISVEFFNGFTKRTVAHGALKPKTSLILTSNLAFSESQRNAQRIVHIPFFVADKMLSESENLEWSKKLKDATLHSSSCIGHIIKLGPKILPAQDGMLGYVSTHLQGVPHRVVKAYALVLSAAKLLCKLTKVVTFNQMKSFFEEHWAPFVLGIHNTSDGPFQLLLNDISKGLKKLRRYELLDTLRVDCMSKEKGMATAIRMSSANGMLESVSVEKAKQLFMEAGGRVNYQVKYQGKAAKSYLMPHSAIPREVLQEWQQLFNVDSEEELESSKGKMMVSSNQHSSFREDFQQSFNANTDLESSKESEMIVSSNEDPRSSSREEFQQSFNANTDLESSKESETIVSSNEDPRSSSREEFQQSFNANTDLESSKEEMIVSSNEDPRSSSREEFQQSFNANTDSNKGESSKEEIVSHSDVGNWEDGSCTVYTPETFVQFTKKCKTTSSPSPETKLYQKFLKTANRDYQRKRLAGFVIIAGETEEHAETKSSRESNHTNQEKKLPDIVTDKNDVPLVSPLVGAASLIRPMTIEDEEEVCAAPICSISRYRGNKIKWIQCDECDRWIHMYCAGLTRKRKTPNYFKCSLCE